MDDQSLGLVHHDDVAVLVHHVQRNVLRRYVHRLRLGQVHLQRLRPGQLVVFRQGFPATGHPALLQQPRRGGAGHILQVRRQPGVHPPSGVLLIRLERQDFHC